ncbi:peptidase [Mycobacteroides abscessus subsp. abscessus]|uniref:metallopeptidase TldD-related protein n=1 Tax=Mycobacteroides abscessus TaxID=36809 RepID=UPI00034DB8A5|nr:metallopeptidase TldD-related protein [Mycobacteroides abscessus]OLT76508.1 peptidase [Mycobacteroides abscessus subsp. abscessus]SHQ14928.1 putative Zn-dependent protease-like protein [Mycobacteroides abscessus subsp. abscessus]SKN66223.1 putative Zn-dependent protease-like protein [Mycobacteroides abscessus subsp. abscessus]
MIPAQQVAEDVLAEAARRGGADDTIVLIQDSSEASLRWAGSSMTTNGESVKRSIAVISILRQGDQTRVGSVLTEDADPAALADLVAASQSEAASAPPSRDAMPLLRPGEAVGESWDAEIVPTSAGVFGSLAADLSTGFDGPDTLYGYARHERQTTFLASSTGLRRRFTQPTGQVEIDAKRGVGSAWAGVCTPEFVDVPTEALLRQLSERLTAAQNQIELTAGRYETLLPPSATGDLMQYLVWTMGGRGAHEGRNAFAGPGGTRIGERLTELPVTVYSDPSYPGLESSPFVATPISRESLSVFDNGVGIERVDWVRDGVINALSYSRADAAEFGAAPTVGADNLVMTGGGSQTLEQMIAATENGLLLTTLWYIREVDPTTLLLTGLTRDGVYLVRDGQITGAVNNYRFNESPIDLLRRVSQVGATEYTLPREWSDYATRQAMPALRIPDFHMSSVSAAQ